MRVVDRTDLIARSVFFVCLPVGPLVIEDLGFFQSDVRFLALSKGLLPADAVVSDRVMRALEGLADFLGWSIGPSDLGRILFGMGTLLDS